MSTVDNWNSQLGLHRMYLNDRVRNRAFHDAIVRHVRPGSRVLDLGSGTGVWACVAARAGAANVVAVEFSDLAEHARATVARNGLTDIVEVIQADIRDVRLERDFDVVIHELIGGLVWEEDMIELTAIAHERFLRPGGVLFPGEVRVWLCPWQMPGDRPHRTDWPAIAGIDFAHLHDAELAQWRTRRRATCVHDIAAAGMLAAPQHVHTARLGIDRDPIPRAIRTEIVGERDAVATGILAFMEIDVGGSQIRTGPLDPPTSWGQLYIPAEEPLHLEPGQRYELCVIPGMFPSGWSVEWRAVHQVRHFASCY